MRAINKIYHGVNMDKKGYFKSRKERTRKVKKTGLTVATLSVCIISILGCGIYISLKGKKENIEKVVVQERLADIKKEIIISAAGDCTLGTDDSFRSGPDFISVFNNYGKDYSYFMKNVRHIFENDDYTIVNLETPFTDSTKKAYKGEGRVFHFKGPKDFVNILTSSSIEGVTIANNHIYDYGKTGMDDTVSTLQANNVQFCGEGHKIIKDINGIKLGFLGYQAWSDTSKLREIIKNDINELKSNGVKIIIPYFHWGIEREYKPYNVQQNLAKYAIDCGADVVLGSHPHVIQSLEVYNGKMIVYSLGNFSFGGNFNPSDKRTFIMQIKINILNDNINDIEFKVIPTMISSVSNKNDYAPTVAVGDNRENILKLLNDISPTLDGKITDDFFSIEK